MGGRGRLVIPSDSEGSLCLTALKPIQRCLGNTRTCLYCTKPFRRAARHDDGVGRRRRAARHDMGVGERDARPRGRACHFEHENPHRKSMSFRPKHALRAERRNLPELRFRYTITLFSRFSLVFARNERRPRYFSAAAARLYDITKYDR